VGFTATSFRAGCFSRFFLRLRPNANFARVAPGKEVLRITLPTFAAAVFPFFFGAFFTTGRGAAITGLIGFIAAGFAAMFFFLALRLRPNAKRAKRAVGDTFKIPFPTFAAIVFPFFFGDFLNTGRNAVEAGFMVVTTGFDDGVSGFVTVTLLMGVPGLVMVIVLFRGVATIVPGTDFLTRLAIGFLPGFMGTGTMVFAGCLAIVGLACVLVFLFIGLPLVCTTELTLTPGFFLPNKKSKKFMV
jgi:hypothetical protein